MLERAVHVIGHVRAALAAFGRIGTEHEVVRRQLAALAEQIPQALFPLRAVEDIFLIDLRPRQLAPLASDLVAQSRQLFFHGEKVAAGTLPFALGNHGMIECGGRIHRELSWKWCGDCARPSVWCAVRYFFFCVASFSARCRMRSTQIAQPFGIPSRCSGRMNPIARCWKASFVPLPSAVRRYCRWFAEGYDIIIGPQISSRVGGLITCTWPHRW